ncbi:putative zinc finger protein, partial [Apostichopus japonicus]
FLKRTFNHGTGNARAVTKSSSMIAQVVSSDVTTLPVAVARSQLSRRFPTKMNAISVTVRDDSAACVRTKRTPKELVDSFYQCQFCNRRFRLKHNWRIHERRHTGEKPYRCPFCPKAFATGGEQRLHERFHTGEKPYECAVCGKRFADSSNCRKHQNAHKKKTMV